MLCCSKHPSSLGRVTPVLQFSCLYTSSSRRYHIGESLIPSVRHYLRFIDADEKVANYGFASKVSVASRLFGWRLTFWEYEARIRHQVQSI